MIGSRSLNSLAVQLFKHVPWVASVWARHHRFVESTAVPWARLAQPVNRSVIALVTTAGVHLDTDSPFDMTDPEGDPSFREFPAASDPRRLTITHKYYDHAPADRDINVVLPLDRLREFVAEGRVGGMGPRVYSFMGHIDGRHLATLMDRTAPAVAQRLRDDVVHAVFLTPA